MQIDIVPTVSMGLQCDIKDGRFKFGTGLEIVPITYSYTNMISRATENVNGSNGTKKYNADYKTNIFSKTNIKFSSGLMAYILPNLLLDTSFLFAVPENFGNVNINNIFSESRINLSLSLTL